MQKGSAMSMTATPSSLRPSHSDSNFADKVAMQHMLFRELSAMFGKEVPLYDKSLLVNTITNRATCDLLGRLHKGFGISDEQLEKTSGERHGAIRIGRPDEYRWVARFFGAFAMEPHNFYDMTSVGSKSQPIIATAFRSAVAPEHRVFTSLLMTDYFAPEEKARIEALLAGREVFSERARELIDKGERQGGLTWDDAHELIREATQRIFKWTATARDYPLYKHLCDAGFKIAADIACFERHHLNHLTPNTFCMDLYTAAMKLVMGEFSKDQFVSRAISALSRLREFADADYMMLTFKHLRAHEVASFSRGVVSDAEVRVLAEATATRLTQPDLDLRTYKHAGFKDFTEGPSEDTPVLLRQDAYKALTEPVAFVNPDGSHTNTTHTARFGEIEQRFYACTPKGRELYDACLTKADAAREADPSIVKRDYAAYQSLYAAPFKPFPKSMRGLLEAGLVYARFHATPKGIASAGSLHTTDIWALVRDGYVAYEGLRYEDFLPVSAAGIFASNLNQYGTKSSATVKPTYTQAQLEAIMGRSIIDSTKAYAGMQAQSLLATYAQLGLAGKLAAATRSELELCAKHAPVAMG
jgi:uncharacterized glyoxalase superfamily metalloenzyme YdcJ